MAQLFVAGIPILLGVAFTGAAAMLTLPLLRMHRSWRRTTGTVVDVEEFKSGGETVRRVEIRFRDASDREWTSASRVMWGTSCYPRNSFVPILFDPEHPGSVRMDTFWEFWLAPAVVAGSGAVALMLGLCFVISQM